ncbi:MAG TPA: membrane dipeptidase, partial [Candidatus Marinimicrobia bacterium]|nr:membrane dipeptidase [Candidatus Neomarinimicrobiota bacterium]
GREVVEEMNRVGIMVDVSHISDNTFYQVMEISKAPAIASHSSCRYFTPNWERNMNDDMIRMLAEKGGVIQINFGSSFISQKSKDLWKKMVQGTSMVMEFLILKMMSQERQSMIQ